MKQKLSSKKRPLERSLPVNPIAVYQFLALRGKIHKKIQKLSDTLRKKYG